MAAEQIAEAALSPSQDDWRPTQGVEVATHRKS
jgi:hypothetical protein